MTFSYTLILALLLLSAPFNIEGKPQISIIYDSLCIDSQFFIQISLGNAIAHDDILDLVDIDLIPGG